MSSFFGDTRPPTLYSIMNSIVNFDKENETKIKDLWKEARIKIFDFEYPLSENIKKEDFEKMILNHYLMRRIGFETFTAFQIQLDIKLNEIMPLYNRMFDILYKEFLGDITVKTGNSNRKTNSKDSSESQNSIENESKTSGKDIQDLRNSELPQNRLDEVRDGSYVTNYNYNTFENNAEDKSSSKGNTKNTANSDTNDKNVYEETIKSTNTIDNLIKLNENIKSIYTLIFKELDILFYDLL